MRWMMATHRFEVRLPEETFKKMSKVAEAHGRSLNRELVQAAEFWAAQSFAEAAQAPRAIPNVRNELLIEALETAAQPEVQETLRRLAELSRSPLGLATGSFARDWDSEEDSVYDDLDGRSPDDAGDDGVQ
jgi:hypothetical protein